MSEATQAYPAETQATQAYPVDSTAPAAVTQVFPVGEVETQPFPAATEATQAFPAEADDDLGAKESAAATQAYAAAAGESQETVETQVYNAESETQPATASSSSSSAAGPVPMEDEQGAVATGGAAEAGEFAEKQQGQEQGEEGEIGVEEGELPPEGEAGEVKVKEEPIAAPDYVMEDGEINEEELQKRLYEAIEGILTSAASVDMLRMKEVLAQLATQFGEDIVKANKKWIKQTVQEVYQKITGAEEQEPEQAGMDDAALMAAAGAAATDLPEEEEEGEGEARGTKRKRRDDDGEWRGEQDDDVDEEDRPKKRRRSKRASDEAESAGGDEGEAVGTRRSRRLRRRREEEGEEAEAAAARWKIPKKAKSAQAFFSQERRKEIREEQPDITPQELAKRLKEEWRQLPKAEKKKYEEMASEDRARYVREMAELEKHNPELYKEVREKELLGKRRGAGSDEEDEGSNTYFDEVLKKAQAGRRRRINPDDVDTKTQTERVSAFINLMRKAAADDVKFIREGKPAVNKLRLLPMVEQQCSKVPLHEELLDENILAAFREWLQPVSPNGEGEEQDRIAFRPDDVLPNVAIRSTIYKLLDKLPVNHEYLQSSDGLGRWLTAYFQRPDETPENKALIKKLIEKWIRPLMNATTDYKRLAEIDAKKALEVAQRKQELGETVLYKYAKGRRQLPQPATMDYAIRPKSQVQFDDEEEGVKSKRAAAAGARAKLRAKLDDRRTAGSRSQAATVDITGSSLNI